MADGFFSVRATREAPNYFKTKCLFKERGFQGSTSQGLTLLEKKKQLKKGIGRGLG